MKTQLFEVEQVGDYHEHWLAEDHKAAAQAAVEHAQEIGVVVSELDVSSMQFPEDGGEGLVYVVNDTRTFLVKDDGTVMEAAR